MNNAQNIAILGAGASGLCAAYELQTRGHKITLFDPAGFPADNASFMAGGMLAPYAEVEHMDHTWIEAAKRSIELWREFSNSGDIEFARKGSYLIAHKDDQYILERFKAHLPKDAADYKHSSEIEPALSERFKAGLFIPSEAHLHPEKTSKALLLALKDKTIFKKEAARPGDISNDYDTIIDARGLGAEDPSLRGVKGEIVIVRNPEFSITRPVRLMHPRYPLYIVPRSQNIFMIGATQIEAENGHHPSLRSAMELMSALYTLHPSFGEADLLEVKSGLRPSYPDNLPRLKRRDNIYSLNGMFRHGWLLAPVMAQSLADMLENKENPYISLFYETHESDRHETDHQRTGT